MTSTDGVTNAIVWAAGSDQRLRGYNGDTGAVIFAGGGANELMAGTRSFNTGIIRGRLRTGVLAKTYPANRPTELSFYHLFGIVCATVADDDDFEGGVRLTQDRVERRNNKSGTIVGRNDYRKSWRFFPA